MAKMEITRTVTNPDDPTPANLYYCNSCGVVTAIPVNKQQSPHACEAMREKTIGKSEGCRGNVHRITIG